MLSSTIIAIGDEILIGETLDTNSHWISGKLNEHGIATHEVMTISDDESHILNAVERALKQSEIVLLTGGLGPTKDDITKFTLAKYFDSEMQMDDIILADVKTIFERLNRPLLEINKQQAMLPEKCTPLRNAQGTAPAMWFEKDGKVLVSMPGVPHEMKHLMHQQVLPKIEDQFHLPVIEHKYIMTAVLGESFIADKLEPVEDSLPHHIKLAYLPNLGYVRLRLSASGTDKKELQAELEEWAQKITKAIPRYVFGYDNETLEGALGKLLLERNATISTAESCTGGTIAAMLTSVAGSSAYFQGSVVSYSNKVKRNNLGVQRETLDHRGAVSEETVFEMVEGVRQAIGTDYGIAVSGIAGPGGGSEEKPVGLVWIAVGDKNRVVTRKYEFPGNRKQNIRISAIVAMDMMRRFITGILRNG